MFPPGSMSGRTERRTEQGAKSGALYQVIYCKVKWSREVDHVLCDERYNDQVHSESFWRAKNDEKANSRLRMAMSVQPTSTGSRLCGYWAPRMIWLQQEARTRIQTASSYLFKRQHVLDNCWTGNIKKRKHPCIHGTLYYEMKPPVDAGKQEA